MVVVNIRNRNQFLNHPVMKNSCHKICHSRTGFPGLLQIQQYRYTRLLAVLLAVATMNLTNGCYYFKVNTKYQPPEGTVRSIQSQQKDFFLHFNQNMWVLSNIEFADNVITAERREISRGEYTYVANPDRPNRYLTKAKNNQKHLLNEVHLYADEYTDMGNNRLSIPLESIRKIETREKDKATTAGSWILGTLGVIAGVYVVILILVLIFKQSCPFIYTFDGEQYHFAGEIFGGAIQPGLERHDFLLLPDLKPVEGEYHLRVTNEIKEIQHINLLVLNVIDHDEHVQVMMDKYGQVHTLADQVMPVTAHTVNGNDVLPLVTGKDEYAYYFNDAVAISYTYDEIILTFPKPAGINEGKLVIRAKNSLWLEHVFANFHELFGGMYNAFDRKEAKRPADEMRELMFNQGFPLSVYVQNEGEWQFIDFYEIAGPMAMKDDILPIHFTDTESETLQIKLKTGYMFWEMDFAAMDFTRNMPLEVTTIQASSAIDENGVDVLGNILFDDQLYYIQPEIGNEANLIFDVPGQISDSRTLILHSKGYYKVLTDQKGRPDWKKLKTFRDPGRMAQFSKELFEHYYAISQQ
jgi:hypothetical protein